MTQGNINAKKVNLRDKPGMKGRVLGTLEAGMELEILGEEGDWLKVGVTGFVHKKFVSREKAPAGAEAGLEPAKGYLWQNETLQNLRLEPERPLSVSGNARQKRLAQTYNQFGNILRSVSVILKMDLGSSLAVICVESGGVGFKDGRMIIRFEPHWFHKLWGKSNQKAFDRHFKFSSWKGETHFYRESEKWTWQAFHGNQSKEWAAFELACGLNDEAAKKSISMGLGQIMGFNHGRIGYERVGRMFDNFGSDVRYQILGMFDFMTPAMKTALARKDYVTFANHYNGSGQAATYGKMIADYVGDWERLT